jgi:hypothetical protein
MGRQVPVAAVVAAGSLEVSIRCSSVWWTERWQTDPISHPKRQSITVEVCNRSTNAKGAKMKYGLEVLISSRPQTEMVYEEQM